MRLYFGSSMGLDVIPEISYGALVWARSFFYQGPLRVPSKGPQENIGP